MPPVGRPRITTNQGARPPVSELGIAEPLNYGVSTDVLKGAVAPWKRWFDTVEYVPEMRWPQSVRQLDQMRTDSQLAALVTAVMYGITQLRFLIDPNGARPQLVKEISEDLNLPIMGKEDEPVGRMKRRFAHHKFCSQAMLAVIYGHQYFEQVGDIVDGKWRLRKLAVRMPQTIQAINVADDGGLVSIQQWAGTQNFQSLAFGQLAPEIPVDRLTAFVFQQEGYSWAGRSMMRDCFRDWVVKDKLVRVEAINHERAGGVPYANAPQGATVGEIEDLDQMMRQFRIGETAGAALPFGATLNIAKGMNSDIDKTIQRINESMARKFMMMVANLAQGGQHVGSYALGDIFDDLWHTSQRAVAQWYCDVVNEHVIEDIVDWNYGEEEELVPKLTWERTREDSLGVQDLSTLVQRGVIIVDDEIENAVRYKYQLPKRTGSRPDYAVGPGVPRQPPENPPETKVDSGAGAQAGAPSPVTPAQTTASFWQRLTGRSKPDVSAASGPVLVTVSNVEILHAGVEYNLSTGPTTFTPEDLRDVVMAANEDASIPSPRLKLGHVDPRFNDPELFDATPSFGKAMNLRLSENGMAVYADYVGVPKWLADIMATAYPSRSIEGYWNVESQMGKKWRFVLSACSLLGVVWPGVTVLEDLPQYYGAEMPDDVQILAEAATVTATGGDPEVKIPFKKDEATAASANMDDVRRAFYNDYVTQETFWWWIQAILVDPNQLVVEDDEDGQLYLIPFESDAEGNISFGDPEPVKIDYIPDNRESRKAAASHVAATLAIGRKVEASWIKREDSVLPNTTASGGAMDPKEIRKRLGLPEDASDEQVQENLRELNSAAGLQVQEPGSGDGGTTGVVPGTTVTPTATGQPEPGAAVTPEGATAEDDPNNVATASGGVQIPKGMTLIDEKTLETLKVGASAGIEIKNENDKSRREQLVAAAIGDGRIAPAGRENWLKALETADKVGDKSAASMLESMPKGIVPVELREIGHGGGGAEGGAAASGGELDQSTVQSWTSTLFPETRQMHEREAALAAGQTPGRPRIVADASYRR